MPPTACYPEVNGNGFCKFIVEQASPYLDSSDPNEAPYAAFYVTSISSRVYRNSGCTVILQEGCTQSSDGSIECEEEEEEEEEPEPTVLVCTASSCLNPNNLQCPTNYVSGSVNGHNVCVRNDEPDPDPDPEPNECEDEDCSTEEIAAIRDAKHGIIDSIQQLGDTIRNGFNDLMDLLDEKLSSQPSGGGDGSGETGSSNVDTSSLNAETPTKDLNIENAQFNDGIYNANPSCPDDKQLNLDLMGRSFSYSFSFSHFCDGLSIVGIFIMIMCYLYSAYIVTKE